ncbi:hypothetical protein [Yinghuangia sp. YIM S09857]|uniref:hypothetical protein n=1 Tax=Yinghuangia sp. YIM S09857 TaxID=3436929 RepID=UPI003F539162
MRRWRRGAERPPDEAVTSGGAEVVPYDSEFADRASIARSPATGSVFGRGLLIAPPGGPSGVSPGGAPGGSSGDPARDISGHGPGDDSGGRRGSARHARPRVRRPRREFRVRLPRGRLRVLAIGVLVAALLGGLATAGALLAPTLDPGDGERKPFGAGGAAPMAAPPLSANAGYFRVVQGPDGRWLFRTPDGLPFYSVGVNAVRSQEDVERGTGRCPYCETVATGFSSPQQWAETAARRLDEWGFNTLGAWSETDLFRARFAYTPVLDLSASAPADGAARDWFDPAFEAHVAGVVRVKALPRSTDPSLLGWFLDDELHWGPDGVAPTTLLDEYLAQPEGTPGRVAAEARRGDPQGFLRDAARRYFEVTTAALRAVDPNHLILGVRATSHSTPPEMVQVAGEFVDVFSVDAYRPTPGAEAQAGGAVVPAAPDLRDFHVLSGRPVLVAEFSARAADAGVPNTVPAGLPVEESQAARADRYREYVDPLFAAPWVVGHHWYRYVDSPPGGRAAPDDGQDSNFGLVSVGDVPWEPLVTRIAATNAGAPGRG